MIYKRCVIKHLKGFKLFSLPSINSIDSIVSIELNAFKLMASNKIIK